MEEDQNLYYSAKYLSHTQRPNSLKDKVLKFSCKVLKKFTKIKP